MKYNKYMLAGILSAMIVFGTVYVGVKKCTNKSAQGQNATGMEKRLEEGYIYSNLTNADSQAETAYIMKNAGIDVPSIETFFDWINEYNKSVDGADKLSAEFSSLPESLQADYSEILLEGKYLDNGEMQMDADCRLTSFLLFHSKVTSTETFEEEDSYLVSDVDAMKSDSLYTPISKQVDKFITLFQPVEVASKSNYDEHVEAILTEWDRRGIEFTSSDQASLITVFFHDDYENKRYVGHAGIKIEVDGVVWFIEKYASGKPYQCTKFLSNEELVQYLLSRTDLGTGTEEKPIVLENNYLLSK